MLDGLNGRYPTYFARELLTKFASPGDTVISAETSYPGVTAYAAKHSDGSIAVLLINKLRNAAKDVAITLGGSSSITVGNIYSYGKAQDDAQRTGIGSPEIANINLLNVDTTFHLTVGPYSMNVVIINP